MQKKTGKEERKIKTVRKRERVRLNHMHRDPVKAEGKRIRLGVKNHFVNID